MDYNSFSAQGDISPFAVTKKWWEEPIENLPAALFGVVKYLKYNQSIRTTQLLTSTRLYGNLTLMGLNGLTYSKIASVTSASSSRLTYNVVQSAIDTVVAKMAKNKPKPLFLTSGGDYKLQRKAEKLTKFVDGIFYENKAYELGTQIFKDACIWGTGALHIFIQDDRLKFERQVITELQVDDMEAFYGFPRSLYRTRTVDRSVLLAMFPEKASVIHDADTAKPDDLGSYPTTADQIVVCEAWHLPSRKDANDGKHVIIIDKAVLFTEKWEHAFFPFAFFHWNKKVFGFWGQGLAEQIQPMQLEINKLLWVIQRSMHLAGSFKILVENGSKIVKEHLNNDIGSVITYTGQQPAYITPPIVQPEVYSHLQLLKQSAFEQAGISMLSAASLKPEGLDSGKALREFNNIESDRFMTVGQEYERLYTGMADVCIELAKEHFGEDGEYRVRVPDRKFIETINWKDVHMKEDEYVLQCYPISSLPQEPAGRLQTIQEMMQAGLIDPDAGRRLLDYPDLEEEESLSNAALDYLHEILDKMVDDGEYTPPEPFDNLQAARKLALEYYAKGKCAGLEEEKLELFRRFLSQLDALNAQAQAAMAPPQPQPQAQPQPAPQSDLLP